MSKENVFAFFKHLEQDEDFRNEFMQDSSLDKNKPETILAAAANRGYPFTLDELETAREEAKEMELNDDDLKKVAGGAGFGICFVVGYGLWLGSEDPHTPNGGQGAKTGTARGYCLGAGLN
jgi:predicted ribosomally synthesized peptide with nif11-like leader